MSEIMLIELITDFPADFAANILSDLKAEMSRLINFSACRSALEYDL